MMIVSDFISSVRRSTQRAAQPNIPIGPHLNLYSQRQAKILLH